MSPFDRAAQRNQQADRLLDETPPTIPQGNLARGIVWADILADIAADDEARRLRDDLRDAA